MKLKRKRYAALIVFAKFKMLPSFSLYSFAFTNVEFTLQANLHVSCCTLSTFSTEDEYIRLGGVFLTTFHKSHF